MKKNLVTLLKKFEALSALACRLTHLTGKAKVPTHPKHLVDFGQVFFLSSLDSEDSVIDLGCHHGENSIKSARICQKVLGLDINPKAINYANKQAKQEQLTNVSFKVADLEKKLPLKANSATAVIFLAVLEHLNNRDQILKEIKRVLKPKGRLFISVPNKNSDWKKLQRSVGLPGVSDKDHKIEFSKEQINKLLSKHGFSKIVINTTAFDTPLAGIIDLIGGISLPLYKLLMNIKLQAGKNSPQNTVGFHIIARNG